MSIFFYIDAEEREVDISFSVSVYGTHFLDTKSCLTADGFENKKDIHKYVWQPQAIKLRAVESVLFSAPLGVSAWQDGRPGINISFSIQCYIFEFALLLGL